MNITLDEIKSKAPPQATHYVEYTGLYIRIEDEKHYHYRDGKWVQIPRYFNNLKPL